VKVVKLGLRLPVISTVEPFTSIFVIELSCTRSWPKAASGCNAIASDTHAESTVFSRSCFIL